MTSSCRRAHRRSTLLAAPLTAVCLAVAGCSSTESSSGAEPSEASSAEAHVMGHVHGLGVDPADDTLYVASHFGVFRVEDGEPVRVADRWMDAMGFVVVGENHFLGSGHPDPDENLPPSLGLVESTDAGETWEPVSLLGEADLHSIAPAGERIYAYDSASQSLLVSEDRQRWDLIAQLLALRDIAADERDPDTVYATTSKGELVRSTDGAEPSPVYGAPKMLSAIDFEPEGPLVGVTYDGTVMVSPSPDGQDGESQWQEAGNLEGVVEALDANPGRWHAATSTGIYESTDNGATWEVVLEHQG